MSRKAANILGVISIAASAMLWWVTLRRISNGLFDQTFAAIFISAFALPAIAAWKSSKLWLVMMLSPVLLYILVLYHIC
jgi:hypothetical protein